jgi:hypothetical protein
MLPIGSKYQNSHIEGWERGTLRTVKVYSADFLPASPLERPKCRRTGFGMAAACPLRCYPAKICLTAFFCLRLPLLLPAQSYPLMARGAMVVEIRPDVALAVKLVPPPTQFSSTAAAQWIQVDVKLRLNKDASALISIEQEFKSDGVISQQRNPIRMRVFRESKLTDISVLSPVTLMTIEESGQYSFLLSLPKEALLADPARKIFLALRSSDGLLNIRNQIINPPDTQQ